VTLRRSVERVESAVYAVAGMTLLGIVVLMSLRVVSRNLGLGLYGLQLYAQALAVWLTFVVAGNLALDDRHIAIEYVSDRLPDRLVPYHRIAVEVVTVFTCAVIVVGAVTAMADFWNSTSPSVDIPIPIYYAAPVVGISMLAAVCLDRLRDAIGRVRR